MTFKKSQNGQCRLDIPSISLRELRQRLRATRVALLITPFEGKHIPGGGCSGFESCAEFQHAVERIDLDAAHGGKYLAAGMAAQSGVEIGQRFADQPVDGAILRYVPSGFGQKQSVGNVSFLPDDAAGGKRDMAQLRRFEDRELAEYAVLKENLVAVRCVPELIDHRSDAIQPTKIIDVPAFVSILDDHKEIQVRMVIEAIKLQPR